jgi:hypothetical protein
MPAPPRLRPGRRSVPAASPFRRRPAGLPDRSVVVQFHLHRVPVGVDRLRGRVPVPRVAARVAPVPDPAEPAVATGTVLAAAQVTPAEAEAEDLQDVRVVARVEAPAAPADRVEAAPEWVEGGRTNAVLVGVVAISKSSSRRN